MQLKNKSITTLISIILASVFVIGFVILVINGVQRTFDKQTIVNCDNGFSLISNEQIKFIKLVDSRITWTGMTENMTSMTFVYTIPPNVTCSLINIYEQ